MAADGSSRGFPEGITQAEHKALVESTDEFRECVVRIIEVKGKGVVGTGCAFLVYNGDNKSLFLTCEHNFPNKSGDYFIRLYPGDNKNYRIEKILWQSEEHDLLLFSVNSVPKRKCLGLSTEQVKIGERVVTLGYVTPNIPMQGKKKDLVLVNDPAPLTGVVITKPLEASENYERIWITCETTAGVSGSPVMFKNGRVIGVLASCDKQWREAISANTVLQDLRKWHGMEKHSESTFEELFKLAHDKP